MFASFILEASIKEIFGLEYDGNEKGAAIYGNSLKYLNRMIFIFVKPNKMHLGSFVILFFGNGQLLFSN